MDMERRHPSVARDSELVLLDASVQASPGGESRQRQLDDFVTKGLATLLRQYAWRQRRVAIRTHDIELMRKPFNKAVLLRLLASRRCWFEDEKGGKLQITVMTLLRLFFARVRAQLLSRQGIGNLQPVLDRFEKRQRKAKVYGSGPAMYLRTDLIFGLQSGGSVTHIAGVINELARKSFGVVMFSTDVIPTVRDDISVDLIRPDPRLRDLPESNALLMNLPTANFLIESLGRTPPRFIYQRYSVNNLAGVIASERLEVPLVLEYNGSEIWVNRHWGGTLHDEQVAQRIERLNLRNADLVVVVSDVLAQEVLQLGVERERVLVNPNGVDPERYSPDVSPEIVRQRYRLEGLQVIGFIGTFGPWHGAEVLVQAFARLVEKQPALADRVRLMMIGDGQQMAAVHRAIESAGLEDRVILTGRVDQCDGPAHLAACDILVSPHVPNPDGSAFFGSPTKLFEYMAMGRPIVASALEQIADVLSDGETALLVPPGDVDALVQALERLVEAPEMRQRLSANAREVALRRHTWQRHTERILARLENLVGG